MTVPAPASLRALALGGVLGLLAATACGSTPAGTPCEFTVDCPSGQSCWTRLDAQSALPGGFCSVTCERVGHSDRCPSDSVCAQTAGRLLCANTCSGPGECREGYTCSPSDPQTDSPGACVVRP